MEEKAHSALKRGPGYEDGIGTGASSANGLAPSVVLRQAHWVAVGRLTPGLIHEINNILCVVGNHVQLLLLNNEGGDVDLVKPLQVINEYADRAQVILHRFAEYARPLEEHSLSRVRVSDLLEDALALAHLQRPLRKLHLRKEWAEGIYEIEGNPNHVMDTFIELLTTAAHAIPCGGTLTISIQSIPSTEPVVSGVEPLRIGPLAELRTGFSDSTSLTTGGSSAGPISGEVVIGFTGVGQWPHASDRGLEFARTLVEQLGGRLVCEAGQDATRCVSTIGPLRQGSAQVLRLSSEQASTELTAGIWVALPQRAPLSSSPAAPYLRGNQNSGGAKFSRNHQ